MQADDHFHGMEVGHADPGLALDVHASAALDRLTGWGAKALRATVAVIVIVDGDRLADASATGREGTQDSAHLREFAAGIQRTGQPHAIGDARTERWRTAGSDAVCLLGAPLLDRDGTAVGSFCVMDVRPRRWTIQDIELVGELATSAMTELELHAARADAEREKHWSALQQGVLELIAGRARLTRTLDELLGAVEAHSPGLLASIMLVERAHGGPDRLRPVAARGLPRGFVAALEEFPIGEGAGICGTAAHRRERVVVPDVTSDPLTADFVKLAESHGLRAGWSTPILSTGGAVLGTFALYYRSARKPDVHDVRVVDRSVHLARLAIEQANDARALRRSATRARHLAREQTALQRVATRAAGETDPAISFAVVAEQASRLLKAEAGYVLRFEDEDRYRNMGSWARDTQRLLPAGAIATHLRDGTCATLRTGRMARRCTVAGDDALGFRHRIGAPVIVDGRTWGIVVALRDSTAFPRGEERRLARFAQLASVVVANTHAREALALQARTDPLTGLGNRRAFDERLAEETARALRHKRALSVVLVDVDHFKSINDRFGHATGDRVLVSLADSLSSAMRTGDLLARIGGDELAMILPDCGAEEAALVTQRMLDAIGTELSLARRHGVTLSAGVVGLAAGQTADQLLRCADQALYGAKDDGRDRVVVYEAGGRARHDATARLTPR